MNKQCLFMLFFFFNLSINALVFGETMTSSLPLQFQVWGAKSDLNFMVPSRKEIKPPHSQKEFYATGKEYWINKISYLTPVYSNANVDDKWDGELTAFACPGEYEPLSFVVRAQRDLEKCAILTFDLKDENGNVIPSNSIDVRVVKGRPRLYGANQYFLFPFFLEAGTEIEISGGTTAQYWLTIKVPDDAKAGIYKGILIFKPFNISGTVANLSLKVLPIQLADSNKSYYMPYNIDPSWKGFYAKNLHKHLVDMKEHGINSVNIFIVPKITRLEDGTLKVHLEEKTAFSVFSMKEFMDEYIRAGLNNLVMHQGIDMAISYYIKNQFNAVPFTPDADEIIAKLAEEIYKQQKKGWPLMIMVPADEPSFSKEKMRLCKYYLNLIKNVDKNIMTAINLNGAVRGVDDITYFDPFLDIKIYAYIDEGVLKKIQSDNSQFWLYNGGSFGKYPAVDRLFFGFYAEKVNAKGVGQWAYQWPHPSAKNESLYTELKYGQYGWYYTCPASTGPLPTIGWEGIREGIDDARYLETLRNLIEKARQQGSKELLTLADESENYVKSILSKIPLSFHRQQGEDKANEEILTYFDGDVRTLDVWRTGIADRIIKLQDLMTSLN